MTTPRTLLLALACGGLLAATALAQTTIVSKSSTSGDDDKGLITFVNSENGKTIKATVKDGEIVEASVDGKTIDPKNITKDDEYFYLKDDSGKELGRLQRELFAFENDGDRGGHATVFKRLGSGDSHGQGHGQGHGGAWVVEPDQQRFKRSVAVARAAEAAPKVMIGVTMTQPDEVLAEHFGLDPEEATMIGFVTKDLPADKAGLRRGDLIVAIDGKTPADERAVRKAIAKKEPGQTIVFSVIQKGQKKDITLTLEAYDGKKLSNAREGVFLNRLPGLDSDEMEKSIRDSIERSLAEVGSARDAAERGRMAADRARELAERLRERSGQWEAFVAPAPPSPPGAPAAMPRSGTFVLPRNLGDLDHKMESLEERLGKLEEMLARLTERLDERLDRMNEQRERTPGGGGNAKPPADEANAPSIAGEIDEDDATPADAHSDEPAIW